MYKKYGLDVESIFIPASSTNVAVLVAGQLKFGNGTGGTIASAAVSGANLVAVACFMNTLPYELIVQESIKTKEQLRGKSIGISRIGSSSDVIARVFLKHLGLEPDKDVAIIQVGGSGERAAAFRTGKIAAFPAPSRSSSSYERHAATGFGEYRGISKALSISLHLRHDNQNLLGEQPAHGETLGYGSDRGRALL